MITCLLNYFAIAGCTGLFNRYRKKIIGNGMATLLALVVSTKVDAASLLGLMSPANTADVLAGAHRFLAEYPQHKVVLRTTEQFTELTESERLQLFNQADVIFTGGVFGDSVDWLMNYLAQPVAQNKTFISVHGDRRLVLASRVKQRLILLGADLDQLMADLPAEQGVDLSAWSQQQLKTYAPYREWLLAKTFWAGRDAQNMEGLFDHLLQLSGEKVNVPEPQLHVPLRILIGNKELNPEQFDLSAKSSWVAVLDYETGDRPGERDLIDQLCTAIKNDGRGCLRVLAKWGEASVRAVDILAAHKQQIHALISLQNFVIGGGEGREQVNKALASLDVPVLKAIRLTDSTRDEWLLSEEGLHWSSVHYRVAMPELQGVVEPIVVAAMTAPSIDQQTGVRLALSEPISSQLSLLTRRLNRWLTLQHKPVKDKKIAIIYYNHPPGRHNIGADNLNVPASLFEILQQLKKAGYKTGPLPESEQALLDLLQERGVNLPEDRQALTTMAAKVTTVNADQYRKWFEQLPSALQTEMVEGPLAYLHVMLQHAIDLDDKDIGRHLLKRVVTDLRHAIEGADHPAKDRVMSLLTQLEQTYNQAFDGRPDWSAAQELVTAIAESGVEGIRGWGELPGKVMVHDKQLIIPGIEFGNIFVGPQPPRGWELNEELLHANLSFPPPHQYVAFYQWLRNSFAADAVVHLGRHSTYEFLPRRRVGLSEADYSLAVLADLPSIYPYIVDGVGEGIQAKRRGLAVIIDHLTPPLDSTDLYDRLLELRQLVETYEAAPESAGSMRQRAITSIKTLVEELKLREELVASMSGELEVRGITEFDQVDDDLLVHEVGHYLTHLQEDFMPLGLHVFGRHWSDEAVKTMLHSMAQGGAVQPEWQALLSGSPAAEMKSLLTALAGQYVEPGKGNDPIRTPEALPTGRNFFALDGSLIPSKLGYDVGVELATIARRSAEPEETDAIVLWASDVVRDEGAMIAFGFDMLGVKPVWSSRGIVQGLQRIDVSNLEEGGKQRIRRDTLFTTSGLFRDLYGAHLIWLERAVLMALDASSEQIRKDYPALSHALNTALEPLGSEQQPGTESLAINQVAASWVKDARDALKQGVEPALAGRQAAYRIFGDAPGTYGAGINRMVERSGSWQHRFELADVYQRRMGHAYGLKLHGEPALETFRQRLATVDNTYMGRASNLYGLLDNNDSFDYLGGLSLAVENVKGKVPENFVIFHPDADHLTIEPLQVALLAELRGRYLNPQWLKPLMAEGYSGARTMGSEFLEYLWGWQVTNPEVIKSWVWDEVKHVYIDDKLDLGLDDFLEQGHNAHVKSNMLAVMLVAAQKGFWQTDQQTLEQLAEKFTQLVLKNGLPGSGHTSPDHPLYPWLEQYVAADQYATLQQLLAATKVDATPATISPSIVAEIDLQTNDVVQQPSKQQNKQPDKKQSDQQMEPLDYIDMVLMLAVLLLMGWWRGTSMPNISKD